MSCFYHLVNVSFSFFCTFSESNPYKKCTTSYNQIKCLLYGCIPLETDEKRFNLNKSTFSMQPIFLPLRAAHCLKQIHIRSHVSLLTIAPVHQRAAFIHKPQTDLLLDWRLKSPAVWYFKLKDICVSSSKSMEDSIFCGLHFVPDLLIAVTHRQQCCRLAVSTPVTSYFHLTLLGINTYSWK